MTPEELLQMSGITAEGWCYNPKTGDFDSVTSIKGKDVEIDEHIYITGCFSNESISAN